MNDRSKVLETFISKLLTVIPRTISVYEFIKEVAQYDKWLKNKKNRSNFLLFSTTPIKLDKEMFF